MPLPASAAALQTEGIASWYGPELQGRQTASGERFDMEALTAAHRSLPFGTRVTVTNLDNGRSVTVRINDRGPFIKGRIIDLSRRAARRLGFEHQGTAPVRLSPVAAGAQPAVADDRQYYAPVLQRALNSSSNWMESDWRNPESGRGGIVMPLTTPVPDSRPYCRNYRRTVWQGSAEAVFVGRACRLAGGGWQIRREAPFAAQG